MSKLTNAFLKSVVAAAATEVSVENAMDEFVELNIERANLSIEQLDEQIGELMLLSVGFEHLSVSCAHMSLESHVERVDLQEQLNVLLAPYNLSAESMNLAISVEGFNETVRKIWGYIVAAIAKLWTHLQILFKELTDVEKALFKEVVRLRKEVATKRSEITNKANVDYSPGMIWLSDNGEFPSSFTQLSTHLSRFYDTGKSLKGDYANLLRQSIDSIHDAFKKIDGTPPSLSAAENTIEQAIDMLEGSKVASHFRHLTKDSGDAAVEGHVFLTYDRALYILSAPKTDIPLDRKASLSGVAIRQHAVSVPSIKQMRAMELREIDALLKAVEEHLSANVKSDAFKVEEELRGKVERLKQAGASLVDLFARAGGPIESSAVNPAIEGLLRFNTIAARWASAPFSQYATISAHLSKAVVRLCSAHLANYSADETESKAKPDREKSEKKAS